MKLFWANVFSKLVAIAACNLFRKLKYRKERSCSCFWVGQRQRLFQEHLDFRTLMFLWLEWPKRT